MDRKTVERLWPKIALESDSLNAFILALNIPETLATFPAPVLKDITQEELFKEQQAFEKARSDRYTLSEFFQALSVAVVRDMPISVEIIEEEAK